MKILIIGGGIAGTSVAEEVRKRDADAEITIIEREANVLYSRVLLPHYVKGKVPREKVFLKNEKWYADHHIGLLSATEAEEIDTKNQFVRISDGRELPYDKLVLATGLSPRLFGADARGVAYLYTVDDADHLRNLLSEVKSLPESDRQAAIYGGGFISCEFANIFAQYHIPFTIIMRSPGFWSRILSEASQKFLANHAASHNIRIITGEPEPELVTEGDDLRALRFQNGDTLECRILGVGIGAQAELGLPKEAGIAVESAIFADQMLQTSAPGVYTAGDAAAVEDSRVGRRVQYGNWLNALMQGKELGTRLVGAEATPRPVSQYATELLGCKIVFIGDVARDAADEVRQVRADDAGCEEHFLRGGKLVGAVLIGDVAARTALAVQIGAPIPE